jgi:imidazolonepropionase-like amidohydrolase
MRRAFFTATLVVLVVAALPAIDAVSGLGALRSATTGQRGSPTPNPQPSVSRPIYITHVTVIATDTGKEVQDRTVVISGERIASIEESKSAKVPSGARVVNGRGKYLIPGLWDMNAHPLAPERRDTYFPLFLANGITGVRVTQAWLPLPEARRWREELASGALVGPRIVGNAGPLVDGAGAPPPPTGGVPRDNTGGIVNVSNAAEARAAVANLQQQGADFIKVYNLLSREAFFAIADETKRRGLSFIGHVPVSVTMAEASEAGQRSMEHLDAPILDCARTNSPETRELMASGKAPTPNQITEAIQSALDDCDPARMTELFKLLAKNDTWQVPTLVQFLFTESPHPEHDPRLKYVIRPIRDEWAAELPFFHDDLWHRHFLLKLRFVRAMHAHGVRFLTGTDTPSLPGTIAGFALHEELKLFVRAGFTPAEALRAATLDAAEFMGKENDFGSVARGKMADLVLLGADPLRDIHSTTRISEVFLGGKEFDRAALDAMLKRAETAASNFRLP